MNTVKIILEGPDNAGKTTLAKYLVDRTQCQYFHAGGPPHNADAEQECMDQQRDVLNSDLNYIVDRVTGISQPVYNPSDVLYPKRRAWIESALQLPNVFLVFCRPPTDWLARSDRFTWRDDETEEHRQKIIKNHMTFIERYDRETERLPKIVYDFTDPIASDVARTHLSNALLGEQLSVDWLMRMTKVGAPE